ncbi:MAG: hypothetical protein ACRDNE_16970 [Gaiellaceae bacterium]
MSPEAWLTNLERSLAEDASGDELPIALVVLASVAGSGVPLDADEAHGAARRAVLLLRAGGDPSRGLDLNGRAVMALADDLRKVDRQIALEDGLRDLRLRAQGLTHVSEAVRALTDAPDVAWRAYAASLLAEKLGAD